MSWQSPSHKTGRGTAQAERTDVPKVPAEKNQQWPDAFILLMGASGTGKSSFVNLASGSQFRVGKGVESCTTNIEISRPFDLDGRRVRLVDTPGFDDTSKSDVDILKVIATYAATLPEVQGIVYLHRISDVRVGGIARRNFTMFQKLCGADAFPNVAIATTRWDQVDLPTGEAREKEFKSKSTLFQPILDKDAALLRHGGNLDSAQAILRHLLSKRPTELLIRKEMVTQKKDVSDTSAGLELRKAVLELAEQQKEEMRELQKEMEEAAKDHDDGTLTELEAEVQALGTKMALLKAEEHKLSGIHVQRPPLTREASKSRVDGPSSVGGAATVVHSASVSTYYPTAPQISKRHKNHGGVPTTEAQEEDQEKLDGINYVIAAIISHFAYLWKKLT